jgi:hypothetical protein
MGLMLKIVFGVILIVSTLLISLFLNAALIMPAAERFHLEPLFVAGVLAFLMFFISKSLKSP